MSNAAQRSNRVLIVATIMLATFMVAIEATIVATAMPRIVGELGGFSYYSWVFSAFLLAQSTTTVIYGKLSDIFGRKPVLIGGILIFLVGSLLCGLAWSMMSLVLFRLLQGLGAGAIQPVTTTIIGDLFKLEERGRVQGFMATVWATSAVVGPLAGGIIVDNISWAWIFWINLPIGVISIIAFMIFLKEDVAHKQAKIDYLGSVLFSISIVALLVMLTETDASAWILISLFAVFVIAGILFLAQEKRAPEPIISIPLWSRRLIATSNAATLLAGMALIGLSTILPLYVQGVLGRSPLVAGFTLTMLVVGWPLAVMLSGRFYRAFGIQRTLRVGSLMFPFRRLFPVVPDTGKLADRCRRRLLLHGLRHGSHQPHQHRAGAGQRRMVDARQRHGLDHLFPQPRQYARRHRARRHPQCRHQPLCERRGGGGPARGAEPADRALGARRRSGDPLRLQCGPALELLGRGRRRGADLLHHLADPGRAQPEARGGGSARKRGGLALSGSACGSAEMLRFHTDGLCWESCRTMSVFVLLLGFPGVGKLTIAKELGSLISAKIVDNHWFNNPILRLLDEEQDRSAAEGHMGVHWQGPAGRPGCNHRL